MPSSVTVRPETSQRPSRQSRYRVEPEGSPGDPSVYTIVVPTGSRLDSFSSLRLAQEEAAVLNHEVPPRPDQLYA
jgi:hypothetical protein